MSRAPIVYVGAALGALLSLYSIAVLDWAHYGDTGFGLTSFPGWPVHAAAVLAFYLSEAWILFGPARHRRPALIGLIVAGVAAAGSAIVLGTHYDNATDLFDSDFIPLVMPFPGLGPFVAVLGILWGWAVVAASGRLTSV